MQVSNDVEPTSMGNLPAGHQLVDQNETGLQRNNDPVAMQLYVFQCANFKKIPEETRCLQRSEDAKRHPMRV